MPLRFAAGVKALLQAAGEAGSALQQVLWGDPASSKVLYPDDLDLEDMATPQSRGQAIASDGTFDFFLSHGLAQFLDRMSVSWAQVSTNATSVAPTYNDSFGFDTGTAITKDEANDRITLTFSSNHTNTYLVVLGYAMTGSPGFIYPYSIAVGSVTVSFYDSAGAKLTINGRTVAVFVIGATAA